MIYDNVLILKRENLTIADDARVDSYSKLECGEGMTIGRFVHIASFTHIGIGGGRVTIGDFAAVASGAKILSGSNKAEGVSMSASAPAEMQVVERKHTVIGAYAFVGVGATILPGVAVGEGAVIGAGAVVTKDVPAWEIWAGVPAKKIGIRSRPERDGGLQQGAFVVG